MRIFYGFRDIRFSENTVGDTKKNNDKMSRRTKNCIASVDFKPFGNYLQYSLLCRNVQGVPKRAEYH